MAQRGDGGMSNPPFNAATLTEAGYRIAEDAALAGRNTFRVAARASLLVDVTDTAALPTVFRYPLVRNAELLVLGEGSNLLLTRDWPGVVLAMKSRGIRALDTDARGTRIRVEAGENWNDFVHWSLASGHVGLENLILIPGTVGAAPIQNIGAYGVEVGEFVETVEAYDRVAHAFVRLDRDACEFAYRDSRFKREPNRHVVTAVEFRLPRERAPRLDYAGVRDELRAIGFDPDTAPASAIGEAIARLRMRKLPNPAVIGNAGSFFKNPIVTREHADRLRANHPGLTCWPVDEARFKLSAAWLIESCGLKGLRQGDAGVSSQHSLVLVNHGTASGAQILELAEHVRATVRATFDVTLDPEPIII
jgi:UDP-N-acetylmuramate dehydrogenase